MLELFDVRCRAGQIYPLVSEAVKRMAWSICPLRISSYRTRPGRMGRPAASAEVHVSGRRAFEFRFQIAPEPACQLPPEELAS